MRAERNLRVLGEATGTTRPWKSGENEIGKKHELGKQVGLVIYYSCMSIMIIVSVCHQWIEVVVVGFAAVVQIALILGNRSLYRQLLELLCWNKVEQVSICFSRMLTLVQYPQQVLLHPLSLSLSLSRSFLASI